MKASNIQTEGMEPSIWREYCNKTATTFLKVLKYINLDQASFWYSHGKIMYIYDIADEIPNKKLPDINREEYAFTHVLSRCQMFNQDFKELTTTLLELMQDMCLFRIKVSDEKKKAVLGEHIFHAAKVIQPIHKTHQAYQRRSPQMKHPILTSHEVIDVSMLRIRIPDIKPCDLQTPV